MSRAKKRVREDRPRVHVTEEARRNVLERFVNALMAQDKGAIMQLLATDVSWTADGGGKAKAARKVVHGRDHVARFVMGVIGRYVGRFSLRTINVNGESGLALIADEQVLSIISVLTDGTQILGVFSVLNPEKLRAVELHDNARA